MNSKFYLLIIASIAMILISGCVSQTDYSSLQTQLQNTQIELNNSQAQADYWQSMYNYSQGQLQASQDQVTSLQTQLTDAQQSSSSTQSQLDMYKNTCGAEIHTGLQPPYLDGSNNNIDIIQNTNAVDQSWQTVRQFLLADDTNQLPYTYNFVCGDFAERIYDDAEARGIRAAFVVVHFSDGSTPHALNAFHTTDRGLVYTDSTGTDPFEQFTTITLGETEYGHTMDNNKIAYVVVGKPLGLVSLGTNYGTTYSEYRRWTQNKNTFISDLQSYNREVSSYNTQVEVFNLNPYSIDEYNRLTAEKRKLTIESDRLDSEAAPLGNFWLPMPTVSSIEIYW